MFKNHPRGLAILFFTEMWERFAYYLMIGIFFLYMTDSATGGLGFPEARGHEIYGWFIALVYLTPFIGGLLADRYLGFRRAVILGGLLMAAGYLGLGMLKGMPAFYSSLAIIIIGNGFFKPNISSVVGRLYPEGSPLRDTGYNIFYMGINIGAFVCNFVAAFLRHQYGWGWAFSAAGIGMVVGVVWFMYGQRQLGAAAERQESGDLAGGNVLLKIVTQVLLPAVAAGVAGFFLSRGIDLQSHVAFFTPGNTAFVFAVLPIVGYYLSLWARAPREEKRPIAALLAIFGVVIVFWMIFHQNGNTLTQWARDHTNRQAGPVVASALRAVHLDEEAPDPRAPVADAGHDEESRSYWWNVPEDEWPAPGEEVTLISTELFQSVNPGFIILLTPLVVGFFTMLRKRGKEPSTPGKIAWGLFITALSTLVMVVGVTLTHGGTVKGSMGWLIGTYGVITVGELCLSPMGLSLVSKLSPARVTGLMMGGWFVATSLGNKMSGVVGELWDLVPSLVWIFWINCISALVAAVAIALMVPWLRRVMEEHHERVTNNNANNDSA